MKPEIERVMMMIRYVLVLMIGAMLAACNGGGTATSPTPAPPPVATTFSLSGRVTDSATSTAIAGATVSIADSINAGKTATTDASGNYSFTGLQQAGFTVNAAAGAYQPSAQSATLTSNLTLNFSLAQQSFAGNWSGMTTQSGTTAVAPITFTVSGANAVTALRVGYKLGSACQAYSTILGIPTPLAIRNTSFAAADPIVTAVSGTFGSGTAASGTATIKWPGQSFEPAACKGTFTLAWTATRQ
jgi:hypothetical protein